MDLISVSATPCLPTNSCILESWVLKHLSIIWCFVHFSRNTQNRLNMQDSHVLLVHYLTQFKYSCFICLEKNIKMKANNCDAVVWVYSIMKWRIKSSFIFFNRLQKLYSTKYDYFNNQNKASLICWNVTKLEELSFYYLFFSSLETLPLFWKWSPLWSINL